MRNVLHRLAVSVGAQAMVDDDDAKSIFRCLKVAVRLKLPFPDCNVSPLWSLDGFPLSRAMIAYFPVHLGRPKKILPVALAASPPQIGHR